MIKDLGQNKYRFVVSVGGRADRKRYCKTVTHKGGKKALQKMYDEFEAECQKTPLTDITVQDLLESYISHCKRRQKARVGTAHVLWQHGKNIPRADGYLMAVLYFF